MRLLILLLVLSLLPVALAEVNEHDGFPKALTDISNAITIADINNDGSPEIVVAPNIRGVYVYSLTGSLLWKATAGSETPAVTTSPLVADVNGDGIKEIVLAGGILSDAYTHGIYIFSSTGALLKSYNLGSGYAPSTPALADGLILVGLSGSYTGLYAFDFSQSLPKWTLAFAGGSERMNSIATGDLDDDGSTEAVLAGGGKVTVVNLAPGSGSVRWQKDVPDVISPVIINANGRKVVVASGSSGTFAWDAAGELVWSNSIAAKYYSDTYSSPAVADLNNDGSDDVIIVRDYDVYAISGIDGSTLFKSSAIANPRGSFRARPAIYDINKDSKPEIIIGDSNGNLYIWDSKGALLNGFPVRITGKVQPTHSSPAVYDLEGDGIPEVAIGSATHLHVVSVKLKSSDTTPPVTTDNVDGAWHNSSVTITLMAKDEESGIAATHYTVDGSEPTSDSSRGTTITLSEEGLYTIKYFSMDNAGNVEEVKTAANRVKIDKTLPSTIDNSDGRWHNGSVVVTLTPSDDGSGIRDTYYATDNESTAKGTTTTISSEGIHSIKYFSIDNAGNVEQIREALVKIDSTPPLTVDDSDNRWHNTDVTLNITASDNLSGIAFIRYKVDGVEQVSNSSNIQLTFNSERVHTIGYSSVDNAGNAEDVKTALVKIDKTSPFTTDDSDGEWHNSSVLVTLKASDNLAGVHTSNYKVNSGTKTWMESLFSWFSSVIGLAETASQGETISIADEGIFDIKYHSDDNAYNIELEKTAKQVKIDRTLPAITVNTPEAKTYLHSDIITLSFVSQDALSGIKTMNSAIDTRQVSGGQLFDMLELSFGTHEFTIMAMDNAGNLNSQKVNFNVIATIDSVKALTERGATNGWISNKGIANSLSAKLNSARAKLDAGQKAAAKNILEAYINEVEAQTNKGITQAGANVLKAEARYVIDTI